MSKPKKSNYLSCYSPQVQQQAQALLDNEKSAAWLLKKHPQAHELASEKALYEYAQGIKNRFMRSSSPISKVTMTTRSTSSTMRWGCIPMRHGYKARS